jgi:hypothetical protein
MVPTKRVSITWDWYKSQEQLVTIHNFRDVLVTRMIAEDKMTDVLDRTGTFQFARYFRDQEAAQEYIDALSAFIASQPGFPQAIFETVDI